MDGRYVYTRVYMPFLPVLKYQKYSDVAEITHAIRRDFAEGQLNTVQSEMLVSPRPLEYLYDIRQDMWETVNLAENDEYADVIDRMRTATLRHALEVGDVMFLPEQLMTDRAAENTPFDLRHDSSYNPLEAMLEVAELVGQPESAPRLVHFLGSDNECIRYWAAVGLFAIRDQLAGLREEVRPHLRDDSPHVRIELAGALLVNESGPPCCDSEARGVLEALLQAEKPRIALQALNKILYSPAAAPEFTSIVRMVHARPHPKTDKSMGLYLHWAAEVFLYLYDNEPLYFKEDGEHVDLSQAVRNW
jgi:hypothetical protein